MSEHTATNKEVGSAFDLLGKSFEVVKKNWVAFAAVNILALLSALFAFRSQPEIQTNSNMSFETWLNSVSGFDIGAFAGFALVIILVVIAAAIYLFAMTTILEVESSAGKQPSVGHLFEKAKQYWLRLLGVMLLTGLVIVAGFILLIIPGIIALGRLAMAPYLMVDKDLGVIEAIKASNEMGKKYFWQVLGAIGVTLLVAIAAGIIGLIPVIGTLIGTIISIAFSLVVVLRYQQLKKIH